MNPIVIGWIGLALCGVGFWSFGWAGLGVGVAIFVVANYVVVRRNQRIAQVNAAA